MANLTVPRLCIPLLFLSLLPRASAQDFWSDTQQTVIADMQADQTKHCREIPIPKPPDPWAFTMATGERDTVDRERRTEDRNTGIQQWCSQLSAMILVRREMLEIYLEGQ